MSPIETLAGRIRAWTGLNVRSGGLRRTFEQHLTARAARCEVSRDAYAARLLSADLPEVQGLLDAITVGHSWFFRDPEQLEAIRTILTGAVSRPLQAWVPACAAGEDAYTLAMIASERGCAVDILATDINRRLLAQAAAAEFEPWAVRDIPPHLRDWLQPCSAGAVLKTERRASVRFARHNLLETAPSSGHGGGWDLILCRNALIYFDRSAATRGVAQLAAALAPGGWLVLGAADINFDCPPALLPTEVSGRWLLRAPASPVSPEPPLMVPTAPTSEDAMTDASLDARHHLSMGMAHYQRACFSEAAHAFRAALCLDPELREAQLHLGLCYERLGRAQEASRAFSLSGAERRR
jgi:chemotaxis protein methyltransferase CheR